MKLHRQDWTMVGAFGAAIAASSCCTVPLLLVTFGIGGAWVSTLARIEPFRPFFVALALLLVGLAFVRSRRAASAECDCEAEANPATRSIMMIIGAGLTVLLLASPWLFTGPSNRSVTANTLIVDEANVSVVVLDVEAMTCASCTSTVSKAINSIRGVIEAKVTYEPPQATVTFDKSLVSVADLTRATRNAGYPSTISPIKDGD